MTTPITVERVSKRFRRNQVLDDISFALPQGSVTGLVGENGVGKTTLIRLLLGLLEADAGEMKVLGLPALAQGVAIRARCGYVPDAFQWYDWMTAEQLCTFVGAFYPTWDVPYATSLLERLSLTNKGKTKTYSKGMKTRLLLVLALAHHPELLLLDEPFSGLDPVVRTDILQLLSEYVAGGERTVLISSHQFSDIERFCDRVMLLHRQHIQLDDSIDAIRAARGELTAMFPAGVPVNLDLHGAQEVSREGNVLTLYYRDGSEALVATLTKAGATVEASPLDLETIFRREVASA